MDLVNGSRENIFRFIDEERKAQDAKWGEATNRDLPLTVWLTVLTEEVGEIAQAILKHRREELRTELIQTAAVAVAMLECLDTPIWAAIADNRVRRATVPPAMLKVHWGVNDSDAG